MKISLIRKIVLLAAMSTLIFSCAKYDSDCQQAAGQVRISPVLTRATDTDFETGDQIGVSIITSDGTAYAANELLTYTDGVFSGDLLWYIGSDASTLVAYYPYSADGTPTNFTVATDQSAGITSNDLIAGVLSNVTPSEDALTVNFKHQLSKILVKVTNESPYDISVVKLTGAALIADVDVASLTATASETSETGDITAFASTANELYSAIVVPQTAALGLSVTLSNAEILTTTLSSTTLVQGGRYTISVTIGEDNSIKVTLSGSVDDWSEEGEIGGEDSEGSEGGSDEEMTAGYVTTPDGERLWITAVGDYTFEYDKGELVMIDDFTITENPFTAKIVYDDFTRTCYLSVNSNGYISQMEIVDSDGENDMLKYSYDSAGHLTKIEGSGSWDYVDDYDWGSESYTTVLTWDGDYLKKSVTSGSYSGKDEYGSYRGSCVDTYEFTYGDDYPKATWQYTPATARAVDFWLSDLTVGLAYIGYFGKGPSYHPTSMKIDEVEYDEWEEDGEWEGENDNYSGSYSYKYSINANGTVYSCAQKSSSASKWGTAEYFKYADYSSYLSSSSTKSLEAASDESAASHSRSVSRGRMRSHRLRNR